jgi:hypothetical protein
MNSLPQTETCDDAEGKKQWYSLEQFNFCPPRIRSNMAIDASHSEQILAFLPFCLEGFAFWFAPTLLRMFAERRLASQYCQLDKKPSRSE